MSERVRWRDRSWYLFVDFCGAKLAERGWERVADESGHRVIGSSGRLRFSFGWELDVRREGPAELMRNWTASNLT